MTSQNAAKAIVYLCSIQNMTTRIGELPGLDTEDYRLLTQFIENNLALLKRMQARAQGLNITRVYEELREAAKLASVEPSTERMQ